MSIYSDKLAHLQVVINCLYSIAQMCTWEDTHAHLFMCNILDYIMSQNELTTDSFTYLDLKLKSKRQHLLNFHQKVDEVTEEFLKLKKNMFQSIALQGPIKKV